MASWFYGVALGAVLLTGLSGCTTGSKVDISEVQPAPEPAPAVDDNGLGADEAEPAPPEPDQTALVSPPGGKFAPKDITKALAGKTFAFSKAGRKGTVSYFSDGTFSYNEKGKGDGTGIWQASDGKLCEAFDPVSFLPKGTRSECVAFSVGDGAYQAGQKRLSPA